MKAVERTGADGVYVDEFGFGWQYPCYNAAHGHATPSAQIRGEAQLLRKLRAALPSEKVLYTEETPTDSTTQFTDGSFTYAVAHGRNSHNPSRVNLTRFALPQFKTIEILCCDRPLGNDLEGARSVFFNGEAIWLEGPLGRPDWFEPPLRELLRRSYAVLHKYRDVFADPNPTPLVPTLQRDVYANRFADDGRVVWTLFNASPAPVEGCLLSVPHVEGATYQDAWNDRPLAPQVVEGNARLRLSLGPREVGCVVQVRRARQIRAGKADLPAGK
jgi:hypothetical protein